MRSRAQDPDLLAGHVATQITRSAWYRTSRAWRITTYRTAVPDLRACGAASFPGSLSGSFACVLMIGPIAQS